MARSLTLAVLALLALAPPAHAQEEVVVTLRATASFAPLVEGIARRVSARVQCAFVVGVPLDGDLDDPSFAPDLGAHVVGLAHRGERIAVFATAPSGRRHVSELGAGSDDAATARAIVVAISLLMQDLAEDVAPPAPDDRSLLVEIDLPPLDASALDDLGSPVRPIRFEPGFVIELRERIGYATQRDEGVSASGLSVGACFGNWWCLLLDVDAMAPEESHPLAGDLRYQTTTIGIGGRFLPLEAGPVRGGVGIDATGRIGHLWTAHPYDTSSFATGIRFLAELTIALGGPVWLAIEGGADVSFGAVRYTRGADTVLNEDVMLPWGALAVRLGPL